MERGNKREISTREIEVDFQVKKTWEVPRGRRTMDSGEETTEGPPLPRVLLCV